MDEDDRIAVTVVPAGMAVLPVMVMPTAMPPVVGMPVITFVFGPKVPAVALAPGNADVRGLYDKVVRRCEDAGKVCCTLTTSGTCGVAWTGPPPSRSSYDSRVVRSPASVIV